MKGRGARAVKRQARNRAFVARQRSEIRHRAVGVVVPNAYQVISASARNEPALRGDAFALREVRIQGEGPRDRGSTILSTIAAAAAGKIVHGVPEHEALVAPRDHGGHRA